MDELGTEKIYAKYEAGTTKEAIEKEAGELKDATRPTKLSEINRNLSKYHVAFEPKDEQPNVGITYFLDKKYNDYTPFVVAYLQEYKNWQSIVSAIWGIELKASTTKKGTIEVVTDSLAVISNPNIEENLRKFAAIPKDAIGVFKNMTNISTVWAELVKVNLNKRMDYLSLRTPAHRREVQLARMEIKSVVIVWLIYLSFGTRVWKAAENSGDMMGVCLNALTTCRIYKFSKNTPIKENELTIGAFLSATFDIGMQVFGYWCQENQGTPSFLSPGGKKINVSFKFPVVMYMTGGASICNALSMSESEKESYLQNLTDYTSSFIEAVGELTGQKRVASAQAVEKAKAATRNYNRNAANSNHLTKTMVKLHAVALSYGINYENQIIAEKTNIWIDRIMK